MNCLSQITNYRLCFENGLTSTSSIAPEIMKKIFTENPMKIGEYDFSGVLSISDHWYGREEQFEELLDVFRKVGSGDTRIWFACLSGEAGIGKSSLASNVAKSALDFGMITVTGTPDMSKGGNPLAGILSALDQLVKSLLMKPAAVLENWENDIVSRLDGYMLRVLAQLIPSTALIFKGVSHDHSENRLESSGLYLFEIIATVLEVFATPFQPMAIYMPEFQVHSQTLHLLKFLDGRKIKYLLFLVYFENDGVYDDEIDDPKIQIDALGIGNMEVKLRNLSLAEVGIVLESAMKPIVQDCSELAAVLHKKSHGNPMALFEAISYSEKNELISFDFNLSRWTWNSAKIADTVNISNNIVSSLLAKVCEFPRDAVHSLKCAACIGLKFDVQMASAITGLSVTKLTTIFNHLVYEGHIINLGYLDVRFAGSNSKSSEFSLNSGSVGSSSAPAAFKAPTGIRKLLFFKFAHPNIHAGIVNMISGSEKCKLHLEIARYMRTDIQEDQKMEFPNPILFQYKLGINLLVEKREIMYVVALLHAASIQASISTQSNTSIEYLEIAMNLLTRIGLTVAWELDPNLSLEIALLLSNCYFKDSDIDRANSIVESIKPQLTADQYLITIKNSIELLVQVNREEEAVKVALHALGIYGINCYSYKSDSNFVAILADFRKTVTQRLCYTETQESELPHMDVITGKFLDVYRSLFKIMRNLQNPQVHSLAIQVGLQIMPFRKSHVFLDALATSIPGLLTSEDDALVDLAKKIVDFISEDIINYSKIFQAHIQVEMLPEVSLFWDTDEWNTFLKNSSFAVIDERKPALAMEAIIYHLIFGLLPGGQTLTNWNSSSDMFGSMVDCTAGRQIWIALQSEMEHMMLGIVSETVYDIATIQNLASYVRMLTAMVFNFPDKIQIVNSFDHHFFNSTWCLADYHLFLIILACESVTSSTSEKNDVDKIVNQDLAVLESLCSRPKSGSHECKLKIAHAQIDIAKGNLFQGLDNYQKAVDSAQASGNILYVAYAFELQRKTFETKGLKSYANFAFSSSLQYWEIWGNDAKVNQLRSLYMNVEELIVPRMFNTATTEANLHGSAGSLLIPGRAPISGKTSGSNIKVDMDVNTVLQVTKLIVNETDLDTLVTTVVNHLLTNTGATKAVFFLVETKALVLHSSHSSDEKSSNIQNGPMEEQAPLFLMTYIQRTRESFLAANMQANTMFSHDPYISEKKPKSILACPILSKGNISGIIYLENTLQSNAFTKGQEELIMSIMASAAISIENTTLAKKNMELSNALQTKPSDGPVYELDAPMMRVLKAINFVKESLGETADVNLIKTLDTVITTLTSEGLFAANLDSVRDEKGKAIDSETKEWIQALMKQQSALSIEKSRSSDVNSNERVQGTSAVMDFNQRMQTDLYSNAMAQLKGTNSNILEVLQKSDNHDFDVFELYSVTEGRPLYFLANYLLRKLDLVVSLNLEESQINSFLENIESSYHCVPYHNSTHASDVLQAAYMLLLQSESANTPFTKIEMFSLVIACAVHDVDHPGVGNNFLLATRHPLANLYNDNAVLESHHVSKAFEISKMEGCDVFGGLNHDQYKQARDLIISVVLATGYIY